MHPPRNKLRCHTKSPKRHPRERDQIDYLPQSTHQKDTAAYQHFLLNPTDFKSGAVIMNRNYLSVLVASLAEANLLKSKYLFLINHTVHCNKKVIKLV